ncbi:MmcQ/YjbR family DNA-binding protein [Sutterella sp.]|uniref:MmcQ/YjbR family DNA-binding protein n=1 Tax=Sutterella sp. TaxID=1981025 RepID=UPI0026DF8AF9|nr:MmcQ/YjbR family DNA-binding protein [Sutterella sp.]MDO5531163.1 MmcQ/YjbR family DNA-binding protein [Sutterella sp.]
MTVEELRRYALTLPGAWDAMPFRTPPSDQYRVFYVGKKWFGLLGLDDADRPFLNLKCDPAESERLRRLYAGITPAWHMNKRLWITVRLDSDVSDEAIRELVAASHALVLAKLPRRDREAIERGEMNAEAEAELSALVKERFGKN